MERNFGLFGGLIPPNDILAPRTWPTPELEAAARSRLELLQSPLTDIPDEVPSGYVPSGRSEPRAPLVMLLAGISGTAVGYLLARMTDGTASLIVDFYNEVGGMFVIALVFAVLAHFLAPLVISLTAGLGVLMSERVAGCRDPRLAERIGWYLSPLTVAATVWFARRLTEVPPLYETMIDGMVGSLWGLAIGLPTVFMFAFTTSNWGWIFLALLGLIALLMTPAVSSAAGVTPYCEQTRTWLDSRVVGRYPFEQLESALTGLALGNPAHLSHLQSLPLDMKVDDKVARLDLTLHSAPGSPTHLVDLTAHYFKDGKSRVQRLLFSEQMNPEQMRVLSEFLGLPAEPNEAAPGAH